MPLLEEGMCLPCGFAQQLMNLPLLGQLLGLHESAETPGERGHHAMDLAGGILHHREQAAQLGPLLNAQAAGKWPFQKGVDVLIQGHGPLRIQDQGIEGGERTASRGTLEQVDPAEDLIEHAAPGLRLFDEPASQLAVDLFQVCPQTREVLR